ncbi:hypothetical protein GCM10018784_76890 [Streptomyces hydrogenans]|nr:hypothetical protein GCM10018784_76890 [Streptomyces hydrogenans]
MAPIIPQDVRAPGLGCGEGAVEGHTGHAGEAGAVRTARAAGPWGLGLGRRRRLLADRDGPERAEVTAGLERCRAEAAAPEGGRGPASPGADAAGPWPGR